MKTDYSKIFPDNRSEGDTVLRQAQLVLLRMFKIIDHVCRKHQIGYWMCSGTLLGAVRHKGFIPWDDDLDICMLREDYERFLEVAPQEFPEDMILQTRELDPSYKYLPLPCKVRDTKSLILSPGFEDEESEKGLFLDIFPADRYHTDPKIFQKEKRIKDYNMFICKCLVAVNFKHLSFNKKVLSLFHPVFHFLEKRYLKRAKKLIDRNRSLGTDCYIGHGFDTLWKRFFKYDDIYPLIELEFEGSLFYAPQNPDVYLTTLYGPNYMTPPPESKRQADQHAYILKPIL
ncbi:lipopolysaccharide cholinephosphotransferase [Parabacteroides sp. PF5-5]|uniref:LicD family protein n=1 Tax=unclassified Parabacteroides TaxID=2649774 RepID=UPI002473A711|nr:MULTISPECIES: LicD family protein [unclassified Parabacteroides]MDH6306151.1 lipopolysaccharide cholinephosphotransferase [Parabacteroides sp. PH5-39]MDH6317110.1 lipopolysaccharide cholinephosphotransferase [Parabacteroides sp. PF5-13]MDH6320863.1 lipopolysaccharide cholinephosphotransferase [Parabacteroides sp. PH5-13]MDH6324594.1 lipopolysaccharide cholinephosphotransferase [Parabacteroides sp. PH5-8]MDH6328355.1 lipopolysaccharide cholinephosphotransferase [Parabacteroides sp. PH5-41]